MDLIRPPAGTQVFAFPWVRKLSRIFLRVSEVRKLQLGVQNAVQPGFKSMRAVPR